MKRFLALFLVVVLSFAALTACSAKTSSTTTSTAKATEAPAKTETAAPAKETEAPAKETEAPAVETAAPAAEAYQWPTEPVNIVGYGKAGGAIDTTLRQWSPYFNEYSGKPLVIDNISGASAIETAHKAAADGYNFHLSSTTLFTCRLSGTLDYDWEDFEVVAAIPSGSAYVICVRADSPYQNFNDLLEAIKANPDKITGGYQVTGHPFYFIGALIKVIGVEPYMVDLGSANDRNTALLGKQVDFIVTSGTGCYSYVESGDFRAIAQGGETRSSVFPDVPTFLEQGINFSFPDQIAVVVAPKGTPAEACEAMNKVINQIYTNEEFRKIMSTTGSIVDFEIPSVADSLAQCRAYADAIAPYVK